MRLNGATASAVGNVREVNEDRAWFGDPLAVLADGMGGHHGGALAAQLAIEQFESVLGELRGASSPATISDQGMANLVQTANRSVHDHAVDNGLPGMGTTLVTLTLQDGPRILIANVGDSRAYRADENGLVQITEDHSFVEDLVRQGRLTREEAAVHPQRNIVTRAIGIGYEVEVDLFAIEDIRIGDRYLLCSDGLFNEVPEAEILAVLRNFDDPASAAHALVETALQTPCRDNVTVVVVDIEDETAESSEQSLDTTLRLGPASIQAEGFGASSRVGGETLSDGALLVDAPTVTPKSSAVEEDRERFRTTADFEVVEENSGGSKGILRTLAWLTVLALCIATGALATFFFVSPTYLLKELPGEGEVYAVYQGLPIETVDVLDRRASGEELADEVDLSLVNAEVAAQCGDRYGSIGELSECLVAHITRLVETEEPANGSGAEAGGGGDPVDNRSPLDERRDVPSESSQSLGAVSGSTYGG